MAARVRWHGTTAQRGYGWQHQQLRARLLAAWRPGDPCARCGRPMWDKRRIDLGHTADRRGYTGLEHTACNRAEGAARGNRMRTRRTMTTRPLRTSRRW